jgi:hypothetical protein
VELVESDCLLCHLKGAAYVATVKAGMAGALKQPRKVAVRRRMSPSAHA